MAVSTWFQNWNPPHNLVPDHQTSFHGPLHLRNFSSTDEDNYTNQRNVFPGHRNNQISNLLPFFLQLGLLDPKEETRGREHPDAPPPVTSSSPPPPERSGPFRTVYRWKTLNFQYPSAQERSRAISDGSFIPENNLPLGVAVWKHRMFVTMPKWKPGVPATLAVLPRKPRETSPKLVPYPNWEYHTTESCLGLTSVFRIQADTCNRLWVLDSGQIDVTIGPKQTCPVSLFVFDLNSDELILRHELPREFIKQDSLYSNIAIDVRDGECDNVHAYLTDVWRFGLVVYSLKRDKSWRITDHLFFPEPLAAAYNVHGLEFEWTDGIFGMALSPWNQAAQDRLLYFHPMSSFREFYVKTSIICNETGWMDSKNGFQVMGQSRGKFGHASASGMDRNGVMVFNMVTRDAVACWDSRKPYKRDNIGILAQNGETMVFPNDLRIDDEERQSVWVLSNKLPFYLYRSLDADEYNFRIMTAYIDEAIKNSICDPGVSNFDTYRTVPDGEDCY